MAAAPRAPDHELVDLDAEREKRGGAYQMPCPKCGNRMYVHGQKCPTCGTWFDGPAFAHSSRGALFGGPTRAVRMRRAAGALAAVFAVILLLLLIVAVVR